MHQLNISRQEVGRRGEELYRQHIRHQVETEATIGKMVIIDIGSGDFEVGDEVEIEELVRAGIPRDPIVLGFQPPQMRKYTDYAAA